jgi:hypothetical protein
MAQASNAPGMTSATRRDEARRKRIQVLQLRAAGESFDAIAQQVGYQSRGNAHRAYEQAMGEVTVAGVTELRKLENERLDALLLAVWPAAKRGDVASVNAALRIMDRRAKLNGLDRPVVLHVEGAGAGMDQPRHVLTLREVLPPELVADERSVRQQALLLHRALSAGNTQAGGGG